MLDAKGSINAKRIAQARIFYVKRNTKKILVVDDEPHIRNLVKLYLHDSYDIIEAENGLEAIEKVFCEHPDAIILDLMMPGIDGYEVCQRLKARALVCQDRR